MRRRLPDLFETVPLVSWSDDAARLLVDSGNDLFIVDPDTGVSPPLSLGDLRDPETDRTLHRPRPSARYLSADRIVLALAPRGQHATRVYSCRIDGTGLQRLSPPDDVALEPHAFPETGRVAFQLEQ